MRFYLGTHHPHWLGKVGIPLFVSHRRLKDRKSLPVAWGPWALDSGGFTELSMHGRWETGVDEYVEAVERYQQIGNLEWAAPQDWMCEPWIIEETGLSVREHQERTISNYLELRGRGPFIPVLQGWEFDDYVACFDLYASAGVDLTSEPLVGVGSVCRRARHRISVEGVHRSLSVGCDDARLRSENRRASELWGHVGVGGFDGVVVHSSPLRPAARMHPSQVVCELSPLRGALVGGSGVPNVRCGACSGRVDERRR